MPKKKRSSTQKKSKAVPDTVVLLPDALLKRYKKNMNKNTNINIIKNVVNVPAPKKSRRRTAKAVSKSGPVRMQGPGMLFSSPPVTIQTPAYSNPPYTVQPRYSQPVIPGNYNDPDTRRISVVSDNKFDPILSEVNPSNLQPANKQSRLVPSSVTTGISPGDYNEIFDTAQFISKGMDRVLANINPFAGLNKVRSDDLPMASNEDISDSSSEVPSVENYFSDSDPGMDIYSERWLGTKLAVPEEAVSSQAASSVPQGLVSHTVPPRMSGDKEIPETVKFTLNPGAKMPPQPEGYMYTPAMQGKPSLILPSGKHVLTTIFGAPIYRKKPQQL